MIGIPHILFIVIILIVSAFITLIESSILALNENNIISINSTDKKRMDTLISVLENKSQALASLSLLNNIVNFIAAFFAAAFVHYKYENFNVIENYYNLLEAILFLFIIVIIGEILPKILGNKYYYLCSYKYVYFTKFCLWLTKPVNYFINLVNLKYNGREGEIKDNKVKFDEIVFTAMKCYSAGIIDDFGKKIITRADRFNNLSAGDIMTQKNRVITLDKSISLSESLKVCRESMYSRLPVIDTIDNSVLGIFNVKEYLKIDLSSSESFNLESYTRKAIFAPETMSIGKLFQKMRDEKTQLIVIEDEYGVFVGIVTLDDILERVFGLIGDEYEDKKQLRHIVKVNGEQKAEVIGSVSLVDLKNILKIPFTDYEIQEYRTIYGYLLNNKGEFLEKDDEFILNNFKYKVTEVSGLKVEKIYIEKV